MDTVYGEVRSSSEGSRSLESSEELGFISEKANPRRKYMKDISERVRSLSFRAVIEIFMGGFIFVLLIVIASHQTTSRSSRKGKVTTYGPSRIPPSIQNMNKTDNILVPETTVKFGNTAGFGPDLVYVDHEMLWNATHKRELHENWQKLYPKSRGYIRATPEPGDVFEYANPAYRLDNAMEPGDHYEGYILSVFHQLHCLVSLPLFTQLSQKYMLTNIKLKSILTARLGTSYEEFGNFTRPQLEHTSHCIEYLRQAILCTADTSLEGETGAWPASAAWGQMHTCKSYDALIELADKRAMWDLSDARRPDLSKIHPDPEETKGKYGGD